jgi:predicted DCC family thiol-disulfide oxidoreductase YuxK
VAALRAFAGAPTADVDLGRAITGALAIALPVAAFIPRLRASVFVGAGLLLAGRLFGALAGAVAGALLIGSGAMAASHPATPCAATEAAAFLVAILFGFDPAWVPGRRGATQAIVFYDGACGLCHRAVRFVVAEDPRGESFRFAPLQSSLLEQRLDDAQRRDLPDSLVVLTDDGRILTRSAAVRFILATLGGWWTLAARLGGFVPRAAGDALYDIVAGGRRRWFAAPAGVCPVASPALRLRFHGGAQLVAGPPAPPGEIPGAGARPVE